MIRAACGTSPTKRARRSRDRIATVRDGLVEIALKSAPVTCRQVFYRAVVAGLVEKTEVEYKSTVCRLLVDLRRSGDLPYQTIADNTRWMRKPTTWDSWEDALNHTARTYRQSLWRDQDAYVEVWLEKDALAGVVVEATREWDVPLMVSRGFASLSFLHSAAEQIVDSGKPAFLYYVGDHDPSGVLIDRKIEETLRELAPESEIHFERIAVTPAQIVEMNLPTRPTKKSRHSRSFVGESVEADAIEPAELRYLVTNAITRHIDNVVYQAALREEQEARRVLGNMACNGLPMTRTVRP